MVDRVNWRAVSTCQDGIRPQFPQGTDRSGDVVAALRDKGAQRNRQILKSNLLQAQIPSSPMLRKTSDQSLMHRGRREEVEAGCA